MSLPQQHGFSMSLDYFLMSLNPFTAPQATHDSSANRVGKYKNAFLGILYIFLVLFYLYDSASQVFQNTDYDGITNTESMVSMGDYLTTVQGDQVVMIYFAKLDLDAETYDYVTNYKQYLNLDFASNSQLEAVNCENADVWKLYQQDPILNLSDAAKTGILSNAFCFSYKDAQTFFIDKTNYISVKRKDGSDRTFPNLITAAITDVKVIQQITVTLNSHYNTKLVQKTNAYAQSLSTGNSLDTTCVWTKAIVDLQLSWLYPTIGEETLTFYSFHNTYNVQLGSEAYYSRIYFLPNTQYLFKQIIVVSCYSAVSAIGGNLAGALAIIAMIKILLFGIPETPPKFFEQNQLLQKVDEDYKPKNADDVITIKGQRYLILNPKPTYITSIGQEEQQRIRTLDKFKRDMYYDQRTRADYVTMSNQIQYHDFALKSLLGDDYFEVLRQYRTKQIYQCESKKSINSVGDKDSEKGKLTFPGIELKTISNAQIEKEKNIQKQYYDIIQDQDTEQLRDDPEFERKIQNYMLKRFKTLLQQEFETVKTVNY